MTPLKIAAIAFNKLFSNFSSRDILILLEQHHYLSKDTDYIHNYFNELALGEAQEFANIIETFIEAVANESIISDLTDWQQEIITAINEVINSSMFAGIFSIEIDYMLALYSHFESFTTIPIKAVNMVEFDNSINHFRQLNQEVTSSDLQLLVDKLLRSDLLDRDSSVDMSTTLSLTKEDLDSLDINSLMTELAIVNLLEYFIQNDATTVVHEVVRSLQELSELICNIVTAKSSKLTLEERSQIESGELNMSSLFSYHYNHLIILKVSSITKSFEEINNNHYVGIRIYLDQISDLYSSECEIYYIDPMGMPINQDIKTFIENELMKFFKEGLPKENELSATSYGHYGEPVLGIHSGDEFSISISFDENFYNGQIQFYDINATKQSNSGLFIIYLLVCELKERPLVSLLDVVDNQESSERIAQYLRELYLGSLTHQEALASEGELLDLSSITLSHFIGPTRYKYELNPFRWQIQEQYMELLNSVHIGARNEFLELGDLINQRIAVLTEDKTISSIFKGIYDRILEIIKEHMISNIVSYANYVRDIDRTEKKPIRSAEYKNESDTIYSDSEEGNDSYQDELRDDESDIIYGDFEGYDDCYNKLEKEYVDAWFTNIQRYIDDNFDDTEYRDWAKDKLEQIYSNNISRLLQNIFLSSLDIEQLIQAEFERSEITTIILENNLSLKAYIDAVFEEKNFQSQILMSEKLFISFIQSVFSSIFTGAHRHYKEFLELYKNPLLFELQDFRIDFLEGLYNKAASKNDLIEMQAIWSVYSKMRREIAKSTTKEVDVDIKKAIQDTIEEHKKYAMRFYPHKSVDILVHKDEHGEEVKYNLVEAIEPLASLAREAKTMLSSRNRKVANIFVPKIVFFIQEKQGLARKKFITIELDLKYEKRFLSRDARDGVMKDSEENHRKKSKADSLKGVNLIKIEDEDVEIATLQQFQCSERVLIEILRERQNIEDIVQLLIREVIYQFDTDVSDSDRLFLIDSITFLGFSEQAACILCAPALIYLQNSFNDDEPLGMLVKAINNILNERGIQLATKGYHIEEQTQDYSQIEINTIIYSDMNSNPQADAMADALSHRNCKIPKATYNPEAKLILPNRAIDILEYRAKPLVVDGTPRYVKPYIIEYCHVIRDNLQEVRDFPGIACISGDKSKNDRVKALFKSHASQGYKSDAPISKQKFSSKGDIHKKKMESQNSKKDLEEAKKQSLKEAEAKGQIGPREILGFDIEDVTDDGNCFYYAIANQMKVLSHNFIQNVPVGTDLNNSLRLALQGVAFRDREWADDSTFDIFITEFPDVILAIIDTRNPNAGFTLYYMSDEGSIVTNMGDPTLVIPDNRMIIRIAATGNHFMSVVSHPNLMNGAMTDPWRAINYDASSLDEVVQNEVNSSIADVKPVSFSSAIIGSVADEDAGMLLTLLGLDPSAHRY